MPVFLDYRTAFVDDEGRLNLRPDLYGHDRDGIIEFEGRACSRTRRGARADAGDSHTAAPGTQTTAMGELRRRCKAFAP